MRPVKAKDLLELDKEMKVVLLSATQNPQTLVWQGGKNDYSEEPIHTKTPPTETDCGNWVIEQLLANERTLLAELSQKDRELLADLLSKLASNFDEEVN